MPYTVQERTLMSQLLLGVGILLLITFTQAVIFGLGLTKRLKREPIVEVKTVDKVMPRFIPVPISKSPPLAATAPLPTPQREKKTTVTARPPAESVPLGSAPPREIQPLPDLPPLPRGLGEKPVISVTQNEGFTFDPPVTDPLEKKLLKEAKAARVAGDLRLVSVKLAEIEGQFGETPHGLALYADLYETMGIFDKAAEFHEKVFSIGLAEAGPLYRLSAEKLKNGFLQNELPVHALAVGTVHQQRNEDIQTGESISLSIPILSSPVEVIDPSQVSVAVRIFDTVDGEILPCLPSNKAIVKWKDDTVDWQVNGLEDLLAEYYLPSTPTDEFGIYGIRSYYGYAIELFYKGELIDQYAWPRILAGRKENLNEFDLNFFPSDGEEIDYNPDNLLLPPALEFTE